MIPVRVELFLLAAGLSVFLLSLLWLTALLSIARQLRLRLLGRSREIGAVPAMSPRAEAPTIPTMSASLRLALREAAPGDATLLIEPGSGPSAQQRTVQRLIAYLQEESAKPASTAQAS